MSVSKKASKTKKGGQGNTDLAPGLSVKGNGVQTKHWCFTLYEKTSKEFDEFLMDERVQYIRAQEELCPTPPHRRHIQGYIIFKKKQYRSIFYKILGVKPHCEPCWNGIGSYNYCLKDDTRMPGGARWDTMPIEAVKPSMPEENILEIININDLCGWAQMLYQVFKNKDKGVWWLHDVYGGIGKSDFINFLGMSHPLETLLLGQGKYADLLNGVYNRWKDGSMKYVKTIIIDLPRENTGVISLAAIECILDGHIFNSKFEGGACFFGKPNIIIMSNSYPKNTSKLSARKWHYFSVSGCARYEQSLQEVNECIWEDE